MRKGWRRPCGRRSRRRPSSGRRGRPPSPGCPRSPGRCPARAV
ncbi:peptidylprolyl isomerase [Streptomyces dengpaensis]|uniref:Peptidylprolyl isomerase n=1 Tax=Streptomyces dengpaensis TaxID=2049881 RepID=A0ABN5IE24_9ACTN|nr:peptidylprolyl isomerase [Streptomyces dengpaensis]